MSNRFQKIIRVISILLVLLILIMSWYIPYKIVSSYPSKQSTVPICRSHLSYTNTIINTYPALKDTFSIKNVNCTTLHWTIVTIKNKTNDDEAKSLFYDPNNSPQAMKIVIGPSVSFDQADLSSHIEIPTTIYKELL